VHSDWLSADHLDLDAIAAARRRAPSDKLREGLLLFDRTIQIMAAGIRHERPGLDSSDIVRLLRERLRLARALETR
jgi:hypothetical protein